MVDDWAKGMTTRRKAYHRVIEGLELLQKESREREARQKTETKAMWASMGKPLKTSEAEYLHTEATEFLDKDIEWINWLRAARDELLKYPPVTWEESQAYDHLLKVINAYLELYTYRTGSSRSVKRDMDWFLKGGGYHG